MSGARILEYILSQECIDKHVLKTKSQLQMGIACSCNGEYVELGVDQFSRERELICYIAVARDVVTKDIRERIPGYQEFYPYNEDPSWTCAEECTQVNHEKVPQFNGQRVITEFCRYDDELDEKHIC